MTDNGKRAAKTPAILVLASYVIVVAGMKAASSLRVALNIVFRMDREFRRRQLRIAV